MIQYSALTQFFRGGFKMQLLRFQTAVFFKKPAERPDLLSGNMPSELLTLFDQIPITNPVPPILQGVPNVPDLPVVTLISSRPGYQGTISKSRADFFYNYTIKRDYSELLSEVSKYSEAFIEYFCAKQQVNRIGIVLTAFIPEENAVKTIAKRYTSRDLQNSEELAVRFNKREQKNGIQLNNIINIRSDSISFEGNVPIQGVIVECDINNIATLTQLTQNECKLIFSHALERYAGEEVKKLIL